ncbi:hypothetical protein BJV78DRAFT_244327 [Lactifluus subvellereus]|nr:hypothetical protein BJV78DRAFT_244327 [Lactifluus subvellereus]
MSIRTRTRSCVSVLTDFVNDTLPQDRWNYDVMEPKGEGRLKEIVGEIKEIAAARIVSLTVLYLCSVSCFCQWCHKCRIQLGRFTFPCLRSLSAVLCMFPVAMDGRPLYP